MEWQSYVSTTFKHSWVKWTLGAGNIHLNSHGLITVYASPWFWRDLAKYYSMWSVIHTQITVFRPKKQTFGCICKSCKSLSYKEAGQPWGLVSPRGNFSSFRWRLVWKCSFSKAPQGTALKEEQRGSSRLPESVACGVCTTHRWVAWMLSRRGKLEIYLPESSHLWVVLLWFCLLIEPGGKVKNLLPSKGYIVVS